MSEDILEMRRIKYLKGKAQTGSASSNFSTVQDLYFLGINLIQT